MIRAIVGQIVGLGRIAVGLLRPGQDVAYNVVGVVELGNRDAAGLLIQDLLQTAISGIGKVVVAGGLAVGIADRLNA